MFCCYLSGGVKGIYADNSQASYTILMGLLCGLIDIRSTLCKYHFTSVSIYKELLFSNFQTWIQTLLSNCWSCSLSWWTFPNVMKCALGGPNLLLVSSTLFCYVPSMVNGSVKFHLISDFKNTFRSILKEYYFQTFSYCHYCMHPYPQGA